MTERLSDAELAGIGALAGTPGDSLHVALARELQEARAVARELLAEFDPRHIDSVSKTTIGTRLSALLPKEPA